MDTFRNFLAIPVAILLGITVPGLYIHMSTWLEKICRWLPWQLSGECMSEGTLFFVIPAVYFWLWVQTLTAGMLAGFTIIYTAMKVAAHESKWLYFLLFLSSLIINLIAIWSNIQKPMEYAIPTVISNLICFSIAGVWPLWLIFSNEKFFKG